MSRTTIRRGLKKLNWKYGRTRYCHFIRPRNIEKRYLWAIKMKKEMEEGKFNFDDVVFTDETKVEMRQYAANCYSLIGEQVGNFETLSL